MAFKTIRGNCKSFVSSMTRTSNTPFVPTITIFMAPLAKAIGVGSSPPAALAYNYERCPDRRVRGRHTVCGTRGVGHHGEHSATQRFGACDLSFVPAINQSVVAGQQGPGSSLGPYAA